MKNIKPLLLLLLILIPLQTTAKPLTITHTGQVTTGGTTAIFAVSEYAPGFNLGVAFTCTGTTAEIVLQFGGFPGTEYPLQVVVQHNETKTVFSDTVRGSPNAGFHSPKIIERHKIEQFLALAFKPDTLISNGYRGFYLILPDHGQTAITLINNC